MFDFKDIKIDKEWIKRFDFNHFIYVISDGTVTYKNCFDDISVSYKSLDWSHKIFEYLLTKDNASLLYYNIEKIENHFNIKIFKKIKKLKWTNKKVKLTFRDYFYHYSKFTLKRIKYIQKGNSFSISAGDCKYEWYKREVDAFSSQLYIQIGVNEQLEMESMPGAKYYQADALSVFIKYKDNQIGLLRFKFLNKDTSYINQGKLISVLYAISYIVFLREHDEKPKLNINKLFSEENDKKIFEKILTKLNNIEKIMIFREPNIGKIFEKYTYKYGPNYYYLHTLHAREGIDISRGSLIEKSILVRNQEIAGKHLDNKQDTFCSNICYFNFTEAILNELIYDDYIIEEFYEEVMDVVNEVFFDAVILQQQTLYFMIKNRTRSSYTNNIKSCHLTHLEVAKSKLEEVEKDFKKKGPNRIKKEARDFKVNCIQKWISFLKENNRIDSGSSKILKFLNENKECEKYIIQEFLIAIPWTDWKDYVYFAKELLKERIGNNQYKKYHNELDLFLELIFSNKSFLYSQDKGGGRAVFFTEIEKQFTAWGQYEMSMKQKGRVASIDKILKSSIIKKAHETLKGFFEQ